MCDALLKPIEKGQISLRLNDFLIKNQIVLFLKGEELFFFETDASAGIGVAKLRHKALLDQKKAHFELYVSASSEADEMLIKQNLITGLLKEAERREIRQISIFCETRDEKTKALLLKAGAVFDKEQDDLSLFWFDLLKETVCRYSVKALIIKDNKILLERCDYGLGAFSKLPGGGQHWGETLTKALERECMEELGLKVEVKRLLFVRDYIAKNHKDTRASQRFHQVELMFECAVSDYTALGNGLSVDGVNQEIYWLELDALEQSDFYPRALIPYLKNKEFLSQTIYLGDVN